MWRGMPLLAVVLTTVAPAAPISAAPEFALEGSATKALSDSGDVSRHLASIRLDPSEMVVQQGRLNYAGPNCPGSRWTCTATEDPVLQIFSRDGERGGRNVAECRPASNLCVIVQMSTSGQNLAECTQHSDQPEGVVTQSCEIIQVNTFGANTALVEQVIRQEAMGSFQDSTQTATLTQENGNGENLATVLQRIDQFARDNVAGLTRGGDLGTSDQIQEGHQLTSTNQDTTSGNNSSKVEQLLSQTAEARTDTSVGLGSVNQQQNASNAGPNSQAKVDQHSDPSHGGTNTSELLQEIRLLADARASTVDQTQGSAGGGLDGFVNQFSSGLSTSVNRQNETQLANADADAVSQTQHGPARCCTTQFNHPGNIFDIVQTSSQTASHPDALQTNELRGSCITSGLCTIDQTVKQNGAVTTNGCSGAACFPFIVCPPLGGTPGDPCAVGIRRVSWNRPQ